MRIENGKLVLERVKCWSCDGSHTANEWVTCPACKGTGKKDPMKPKGPNCPNCKKQSSYARGKVISEGTAVCSSCDSDGFRMESRFDSAPKELWQSLTFKVYRSNRHQTIGEHLLGCGVYSCTDYGEHKNLSDEDLIRKVQFAAHSHHQATKFTKPDLTLCDHIGIFCNQMGYTVQAVYDNPQQIEGELKRGLDVTTGMAVGTQLAAEGFNGTALVTDYKKPE